MTDIEKLNKVEEIAKDLIFNTTWCINTTNGVRKINISDLNYTFRFNNRLTRVLGRCNYTTKIIELSTKYTLANYDNIAVIEDTIRHEIAHAIAYILFGEKARGHGRYWKHVAVEVGAKPSRCKTEDQIISVTKKRDVVYKCPSPDCDNEISFTRKVSKKRACKSCCDKHNNGRFDPKYIFQLVE